MKNVLINVKHTSAGKLVHTHHCFCFVSLIKPLVCNSGRKPRRSYRKSFWKPKPTTARRRKLNWWVLLQSMESLFYCMSCIFTLAHGLIPAHRDAEHCVPHLLQNPEESAEVHLAALRFRRSCKVSSTWCVWLLYYSVVPLCSWVTWFKLFPAGLLIW